MFSDELLYHNVIFSPKTARLFLSAACPMEIVRGKRKLRYYNVPAAFDIETTSFYFDGEKRAIMYEFSIGINGYLLVGRRWSDFVSVLETISQTLCLNEDLRLILYVHNLQFDFQFFRKHLHFVKVFAIDARKPVYAICDIGIEFRCSYILSGYSLEKLAENCTMYKIEKQVGSLDYEKIRHTETPLTDDEKIYNVFDVMVIMCYIQEEIVNCHGIQRIPLTKTGYVREFVRDSCWGKGEKTYKRAAYSEFIHGLTLTTDEYRQLKRAFQGGFTHANAFYAGKKLDSVSSDDFCSSYPAVMIAEEFPMSKAESITITSLEELEKNLKLYCCLFDIELFDVEPRIFHENYLSISRCWDVCRPVVNNGRIAYADHLYTTITEQDYLIIKNCYTWSKARIYNFRRYRKGYLPTDFVKAILTLYNDKTTLKGIAGKEVEYLKSKGNLNSCYGMAVTDIVRPQYTYQDDVWDETSDADIEKEIDKYNKSHTRFMFYPWGVWVTAYARRNLFTAILAFGNDYVYSDTDSIKSVNRENHQEYIDKYNKIVTEKLHRACDYHHISYDSIEPKTKEGIKKPLGVWESEKGYTHFKTLGAKRYMTENDEGLSITVSGLNKKIAVPYMQETFADVWASFDNSLYIPAGKTGKQTHTYIDDEMHGVVTDYRGNTAEYHELSGVHLEPADYSLSLAEEYVKFILNVQEDSI